MSALAWATVTQLSPLRVRFDGDAAALVLTPESLVDPGALLVGSRVRVELYDRRIIIVGLAGGDARLSPVVADVAALGGGVAFSRTNAIRNPDWRVNQALYVSGTAVAPQQYITGEWIASGLTNTVRNPRCGTNTTDWAVFSITGSGARVTSGGPNADIPTFYRATLSGALSANVGGIYITDAGVPARIGGSTQIVSAWVRSSAAITMRISCQPYTAPGGASVGSISFTNLAIAANTWTRISVVIEMPVSASAIRIHFIPQTAMSSGATFDATGVMVHQGSRLYDYVDGAMTGCSWAGTAHASTSYNVASLGSVTLPTDPQGGLATLSSGMRVYQAIERADQPARDELLDWEGTALGRFYPASTAPGSRPAFAAAPILIPAYGGYNDDIIVEFQASGGTRTLGRVQLIPGLAPQAYMPRLLADELALCRRYFYQLNVLTSTPDYTPLGLGQHYAGITKTYWPLRFPVPMRAAPVVAFTGSPGATRAHQRGIAIGTASAVAPENTGANVSNEACEWMFTTSALSNGAATLIQTVAGAACGFVHDANLREFAP